jgi:hypothetical protein
MMMAIESLTLTRTADGRVFALAWPREIAIAPELLAVADLTYLDANGDIVNFYCANGTATYRRTGTTAAGDWVCQRMDES